MLRKLSEPAYLGSEVKRRTLANLADLTPNESELFNRTKVIAAPDKFFQKKEKEYDLDFNLLGYAPDDPFVGQPFHQPEVYVRQKPVTPALTLGNIQRTGTDALISPEEVLPHEIGHVMSQQLNPRRSLAYKNLDDEDFAVSFDKVVTEGKRSLTRPYTEPLAGPMNRAQRRFNRLTYSA